MTFTWMLSSKGLTHVADVRPFTPVWDIEEENFHMISVLHVYVSMKSLEEEDFSGVIYTC